MRVKRSVAALRGSSHNELTSAKKELKVCRRTANPSSSVQYSSEVNAPTGLRTVQRRQQYTDDCVSEVTTRNAVSSQLRMKVTARHPLYCLSSKAYNALRFTNRYGVVKHCVESLVIAACHTTGALLVGSALVVVTCANSFVVLMMPDGSRSSLRDASQSGAAPTAQFY